MRPSSRSPLFVRQQVLTCLLAGACSLLAVQPSAANAQPPDRLEPDRQGPGREAPAQQTPAPQTAAADTPPPLGTVLPHGEDGTIVVRNDRAVAVSGHAPLTTGDIVRTDPFASATIVLAKRRS
jgi:hypothetical protein